MAIERDTLRFLLLAQAEGVDYARTLTLGRLAVEPDAAAITETFAGFGRPLSEDRARAILRSARGYAEPLFRELGARLVESLDASPYQGSTVTFDLNQALPGDLRRKFTAVLDAGTLEHVFDAPRALRNCMEMVAPGGHLLIYAPANDYFGHGFYQFGPEFYFRALSNESGFCVERMLLSRQSEPAWYTIEDPASTGRRAEAPVGSGPMVIVVKARRLNDNPALTSIPQQSDYEAVWRTISNRSLAGNLLRRSAPRALKTAVRRRTRSLRATASSAPLTAVSPEALARRAEADGHRASA